MNYRIAENVYIGYGIGCHYHSVSEQIKKQLRLSYLCDRKWNEEVLTYDNIPVISLADIPKIEKAKVIIFPCDVPIKMAIAKELQELGIEYVFVEHLLGRRQINGKIIKEEGKNGVWKDVFDNTIYYDSSLPDEIIVYLDGTENEIYFAANIVVNRLSICMGNKGRCEIGANTRIVGVNMYIAYAIVKIGEDCLFSSGVMIRTHDAHHIFDRNSHERINVPKDVVLENHVWVGEGAFLLPGTRIGEGSVVGARTVTSAQFEDHVVIAGIPARVIRRDVCWSKDSTDCMNYSCFEECVTDDAYRYC